MNVRGKNYSSIRATIDLSMMNIPFEQNKTITMNVGLNQRKNTQVDRLYPVYKILSSNLMNRRSFDAQMNWQRSRARNRQVKVEAKERIEAVESIKQNTRKLKEEDSRHKYEEVVERNIQISNQDIQTSDQ